MSWKSSTSRIRSPSGSVILGDANVSQSSLWRREKAREMRSAGFGPPTGQTGFLVPDNAAVVNIPRAAQ